MKKIVTLLLTMIMVLSCCFVADAANIGDVINKTVYTDIVTKINGSDIASFNIDGYTVVVAEDLRGYGFVVEWRAEERALYITKNTSANRVTSTYTAPVISKSMVGVKANDVLYSDIKTYIDGKLVTSYNIGGQTVIYFDDLKKYGSVSYDDSIRTLSATFSWLKNPGEDDADEAVKIDVVETPTVQRGTLQNPYGALEGAPVIHQRWSSDPIRKVSIKCTNVIRGSKANSIAKSENSYNDTPNSSQEWCFLEFDVKYISATGGGDNVLKGSNIIYKDTFFTAEGSSLNVAEMATLGSKYKGYGVFDTEFYPGASGKVVIGLLIPKNAGDILLRVPDRASESPAWINCTNDLGMKPSEDYTEAEENVEVEEGSLQKPYGASDGNSITYQRWSSDPIRKVSIKCTNVIRGSKANSLAKSENSYNDTPNSSQEWCFLEFDVKYISATGGGDNVLKGSDIIYKDTFFTAEGSSLNVAEMATLGSKYKGYGVFDTEFYPGASGKVVIGLLIPKNTGDILLRVPDKAASSSWINCTKGVDSSSSYSGSSSSKDKTISGSDENSDTDGAQELIEYITTYGMKRGIGYYIDKVDKSNGYIYTAEIRYIPSTGNLEFIQFLEKDSMSMNVGLTFNPETKKVNDNKINGNYLDTKYASVVTAQAKFNAKTVSTDTEFNFVQSIPGLNEIDDVYEILNTLAKLGVLNWKMMIVSTGIDAESIGFLAL